MTSQLQEKQERYNFIYKSYLIKYNRSVILARPLQILTRSSMLHLHVLRVISLVTELLIARNAPKIKKGSNKYL